MQTDRDTLLGYLKSNNKQAWANALLFLLQQDNMEPHSGGLNADRVTGLMTWSSTDPSPYAPNIRTLSVFFNNVADLPYYTMQKTHRIKACIRWD